MNIDIVFMNLTKLKNIRLMSKIPTQYLQAWWAGYTIMYTELGFP